MKKFLLVLTVCILTIGQVLAQSQTITGKVVSAVDGEGIPGAAISVLGTSRGTVSDYTGAFRIEAEPGATLVVSFVGMRSVTVPASTSEMTITLEEDTEVLDEVVVTALGISRSEKTLGYAATKVEAEEITKARATNVANALAGKVAGVQVQATSTDPGAASNIIIRGFSSIGSSNQPLYVIDGIPLQNTTDYGTGSQDEKATALGGISNIAAQDIESMTVLKGAAATALYGSRAANGVVIITTKQGAKGEKRNFNIEYNGGPADVPEPVRSRMERSTDLHRERFMGSRSGRFNPSLRSRMEQSGVDPQVFCCSDQHQGLLRHRNLAEPQHLVQRCFC